MLWRQPQERRGRRLSRAELMERHTRTFEHSLLCWPHPRRKAESNSLVSGQRGGLRRRRSRVQIAAATLSGNSLRQTVYTRRASVHQSAKLVAALSEREVERICAGCCCCRRKDGSPIARGYYACTVKTAAHDSRGAFILLHGKVIHQQRARTTVML